MLLMQYAHNRLCSCQCR
uniref:Uncharacterized protein n=1 Tax=Anguilla anguilla TaxID=7936 RepID=A0A0E9TJN2_ANGAN